ncbi:MAG: hypothetical protein OXC44_02645 [Proteobacteria bacterium]|nr:hypothetical protein [Pseudomonadota bacterium]
MVIQLFERWLERWRRHREKGYEKRVNAYAKVIRKDNVHKQERKAAIDFFCMLEDSSIAVLHLLKRFDFSDENSIVDSKEKEAALAGIISHGQDAIPIIKDYLHKTERIAWPLKALLKLAGEEEVVSALDACLDLGKVDFDQSKVEKNFDVLCHFLDYEHIPNLANIAHFIDDRDERIRYAAVEIVTEKGGKEYLSKLEPYIFDELAENTRIRNVVLEAYVRHKWLIKDLDRISSLKIPGYSLSSKGLVTKVSG